MADLGAVGPRETELAGRVAALQWRLRRVTAFEAAVGSPIPPGPTVPTGAALATVLRCEPPLARELADALALFVRVMGRRA